MKRLSLIALLFVWAAGLTYAFAIAGNSATSSSAKTDCSCATCGCTECDGACDATAAQPSSLPKQSCCSIFTDAAVPAAFPVAKADCGCTDCKCPNCDGKNCSCDKDCKCGKCGCKKS